MYLAGFYFNFNLQLPGKTQNMSGNMMESASELPQIAKIDHDVNVETGPWTLMGRQTQS